MGLDMYLDRFPRYKNATPDDISAAENYVEWKNDRDAGKSAAKYTFQEWTGRTADPDPDIVSFVEHNMKTMHYYWDDEKRYPHLRVIENVGYWRKANAIHNWFVNNVQDGVDDCAFHDEVTKENLEELRDICHEVLCDPDMAEALLPTQGGFFFGSIVYDEWYIDDLKRTIDIIDKVLETTDFDKQMIYYVSSW